VCNRALVICFVLIAAAVTAGCGGSNGATSPTPSPTTGSVEVAPGVFAREETAPPAPAGATVLSSYYVFDSTQDTAVVIGVPLTQQQGADSQAGFFTYTPNAGWTGVICAISLKEGGAVLEGAFPKVPSNLMVLIWPGGQGTPQ